MGPAGALVRSCRCFLGSDSCLNGSRSVLPGADGWFRMQNGVGHLAWNPDSLTCACRSFIQFLAHFVTSSLILFLEFVHSSPQTAMLLFLTTLPWLTVVPGTWCRFIEDLLEEWTNMVLMFSLMCLIEDLRLPWTCPFASILVRWAVRSVYLPYADTLFICLFFLCFFFPFICSLSLETVGLIIFDFKHMWFLVLTLSLDLGPRISRLDLQHFNFLVYKVEMSLIFARILELLVLVSWHCKNFP